MTGFVSELMGRRARRMDEPDTINTARAMREATVADGRAWMVAWLTGRTGP